MSVPIPLRADFDAVQLRGLARKTKDGPQARRLLALAAIYDGATRTEAAKIGGVGLQIIRDWVLRFNARGSDGLIDGKSPGQPSRLNDAQRQAIGLMIENGPISAVHGVVRWRLVDLAQWIFEEFRITIAKPGTARHGPNTTQELLEAAWRHCGAIQDIIDGLNEAATNTEPRVLANWLHRLAFRLQPTTSEKINQSKGLAEALGKENK